NVEAMRAVANAISRSEITVPAARPVFCLLSEAGSGFAMVKGFLALLMLLLVVACNRDAAEQDTTTQDATATAAATDTAPATDTSLAVTGTAVVTPTDTSSTLVTPTTTTASETSATTTSGTVVSTTTH